MRLDWKYVVTLAAAIAGTAVPIWLWQVDLHAKSLVVKLISVVELQASLTPSIPDLQLTLAGKRIESPVLYTLEISNDGSKPVPTADFESPLELQVDKGAEVIRASVASVEPPDVSAEVDSGPQTIRLKPLLLNPGDKLRLTVLTSGKIAKLVPKTRIAGISAVRFESENAVGKRTPIVLNAIAGAAGYFLYFVFGGLIVPSSRSRIPRLLSGATMIVLLMLSTSAVRRALDLSGIEPGFSNSWPILLIVLIAGVITFFRARRWYRFSAV